MSEHNPPQEADVGDLVEQKRLTAIMSARDDCKEAQKQFGEARSVGQIRPSVANKEFSRAVDLYLQELEFLLRNTETGRGYLTDIEVGTWVLHPPSAVDVAWMHKDQNEVGYAHDREATDGLPPDYQLLKEHDFDQKEIVINGLLEYLELPAEKAVEHSAVFHIEFHGEEEMTQTVTRTMPWEVSRTAFRIANEFAGKVGLGIGTSGGEIDADAI